MLNTTVERKYNFDKVIAHTSFLGHTGYNNHSREFFTALNNLIPTRIRNFTHTPSINYLTQIQKDMIIKQTWKQAPFSVGTPYSPNDSENIINIILNESHHYYFYDKYKGPKIAYNVWESTRQIDEFFNQLLTYDQLWVPTKWQRDSTIEQGYPENKIKIVPEGVDGNIFKPGTQIDPNPKYIKNDRFSFMIFGRWDYRKSIGEMIQAFLNTFKKEEPVDLIISVDNPFSVDNMQSTEERLHHWRLEDSRIKILHFPPFSIYVKYLQQGNVFLSCSRAEGWNLPLIEAIACGTVSICSNYGAQLDFADNIANKVNIKDFIEPTDFFLNDTGKIPGIWAEPDFDHLEYVMRDVYENYSNLKSKAIEGSKQVRKKFTWENAANIAYKHLEELPSIKSISNPEVLLSVPVKETNIPYKEINTDKIIDIYKQTIDKIYGEVFVIGCHANTEEKLKLLKENINKIKELNIPIVITTHYPIPIEIQQQVDFVLYEKENILSGDNKLRYWFHSPDYVKIVGDCEKGNYQSVAIISLIRNAINFCKSYSYIHYLESDTIINIPEYLTKVRRGFKNQKKCVFFNYQDTISFITNIFSFNIEWFDKVFDKINSWEEYLQVDVDRAKSLDRKGNWVFESWMHTLFEAKDLYKDTLLLNNLDRDNIIIKNNIIDRGNEEPLLRAFLAETNNNKVVLFIINDSNNNETWEIYKDNKLHIEQELPPHNVTWALWDKVNTNFTIKFKSKSILDLNLSIESTKIYDNTSFKFFDNTDIKALDWVWGDKDKDKNKINFNFIKGCFLELLGKERDHIFNYQIIDNDTSKVIYEDTLFINHHIKCSIEYYVDYLLKITNIKTKKVIFEHKFNLIGKRVLIEFDSKALGDSIAWIPYVEEFRVKHECTIFVSTFHNNLFKNEYPELNFVKPGTVINNLYAQYVLGCFEPADETNRSPFDYRSIPLQKIATSILGLDFKEIKPKIHIPKNINNFKSKYVCIAIHSTSQAKYWNNSKGWQKVVDYLHSINYKVVLLSKENAKYMNNKPPLGIIKKTGDSYSIEDRITDLYYADFFIGLSSGLSWLAWAIGTSVILISGHSKPWYEPQTDITRIYNPKVCSGCFNETNVIFDKGDWNWCLCNKKFECTKSISSEMVIDAIDNIIAK